MCCHAVHFNVSIFSNKENRESQEHKFHTTHSTHYKLVKRTSSFIIISRGRKQTTNQLSVSYTEQASYRE